MLKELLLATLVLTALAQVRPAAMAMDSARMAMDSAMTMDSSMIKAAVDAMPSMTAMPSMSNPGSSDSSNPNAPPSSNMAMDTSTSDKASISSSSSGMTTMAMMSMSPGSSSDMTRSASSFTSGSSGSNLFYNTNNAWTYIQNIGGTCCNNCSKICGFGIKIYGTNYYLTNRGSYFTFDYTTNPGSNQIFTIGQNSDCTWYISNNGQYLSTSSPYGAYVGVRGNVGAAERWYIERNNGYVVVQSAYSIYNYWRYTSGYTYYLGYSYGFSSRFTFEYIPCEKRYGWNW